MTHNPAEMRIQEARPLIEQVGESSRRTEEWVDVRDPVFFVPGIRSLKLRSDARGGATARFLSQLAARSPTDLKSQVQRIHLHLAEEDADRTYGALVDLFITLGDRGRALRQRMLTLCKPLLEPARYQALAAKIEQGLSFSDPIPVAAESRLSKGITGACRLLERAAAADNRHLDVMEVVHSHLEYGQLAQAREELEAAVLKMPWRSDLHTELLELYDHTDDRESFNCMRQLLDATDNPCAEAWQALSEKLPRQSTENTETVQLRR